MNYNWNRMERANEAADQMALFIKQNRWKDVKKAAEEWPELLFWEPLEVNMGANLFLQIWEEDRWVGRDIIRMLLKRPELLKKISLANYGISTFQVNRNEYWVYGPMLGLLAGAGELDLMEDALKVGLNPDGWTDGGWYEGTDGMYFFSQPSGCSLYQNRCYPYRSYHLFGENETTPLLIAIMREDVDMVRLLIQYGATFVPEGELCQEYLKELSSWTIRKLLEDAYGGGKTHG